MPAKISLLLSYFVIPNLLSQSAKELLLDIKFYYSIIIN